MATENDGISSVEYDFVRRVVTPQTIEQGDRIMHRPPDTRQRREYVGTACGPAHCCSLDAEETMWKVYLDGGPIGRLFMIKNECIVVQRRTRKGRHATE